LRIIIGKQDAATGGRFRRDDGVGFGHAAFIVLRQRFPKSLLNSVILESSYTKPAALARLVCRQQHLL
jgi:hypothetical protein